jgi:CheY-like chemotaxis protein
MAHYLIVDDNEALADNLGEILADAGHQPVLARDGAEALARVRAQRFDALLTDMRMPVMSGAQLVHEIRSLDPGLPAIILTAYSGADDLSTARREGLLAVLSKPVSPPRLLEVLESARRDGVVVLVEDDVEFADNLSEILRQRGFTTVVASSVLETQRLGALQPFAAIADLRVPEGADGAAMQQLLLRFPGLPILVTTGYDLAPPPGTRQLFQKPVNPQQLLAALEKLYRPAHA